LIVSRIPMKYVDHIIYKKGVHSDAWAAKGCTLVELEKDGVAFQVAGTHLQAEDSEAAISQRDLQFKDIRILLDRNQMDTLPVFVIGDMNTRKSDAIKYPLMLKVIGVQDFPLDDDFPFTFDANNYWNEGAEASQIDYILIQPRQTKTQILFQHILRPKQAYKGEEIDLADHYGIVGDMLIFN